MRRVFVDAVGIAVVVVVVVVVFVVGFGVALLVPRLLFDNNWNVANCVGYCGELTHSIAKGTLTLCAGARSLYFGGSFTLLRGLTHSSARAHLLTVGDAVGVVPARAHTRTH